MEGYKERLLSHEIFSVEMLVDHYRHVLSQFNYDVYEHKYDMIIQMPQPYQNLFLYTALSCARDIKECFVSRYMDAFKYINQFLYIFCKDALCCDFTVDNDEFKQIDYLAEQIESGRVVSCLPETDDIRDIYVMLTTDKLIDDYPHKDEYLEDGDYDICVSDKYYDICSAHAQKVLDKIGSVSADFDKARGLYVVDNMQYELIGSEIRGIRASMGLTQEQFARKFAINVGTLAHWEQGHRKPPIHVSRMLEIIRNLENQVEELSKSSNIIGQWLVDFVNSTNAEEYHMVHILPDDIYMDIDMALSEYRIRKIIGEPKIVGNKPYQCIEFNTVVEK